MNTTSIIDSAPRPVTTSTPPLATPPHVLCVSGKMAAGKDTVAPAFFEHFGVTNTQRVYFADALKNEVDDILTLFRVGATDAEVADKLAAPVHHVTTVRTTLGELAPDVHARSRIPAMRTVLQFWGTDVRRANDEDYWVRISTQEVVELVTAGKFVYVTDARFPNEVSTLADLGAFTVRLDVCEDTQRSRIWERDGVHADPAAFTHPSEVALDDYPNFQLRFTNEGSVTEAVQHMAHIWSQSVLF